MPFLVISQGPSVGTIFHLRPGTNLIGREAFADIHVSGEETSRQHARVKVSRGNAVIEDLGSRNGTLVNDARVSRYVLKEGDQVQIGKATFIFCEALPQEDDEGSETVVSILPPEADGAADGPGVLPADTLDLAELERELRDFPADRRNLAVLYSVGQTISSELDLSQLLENVMDTILKVLPVDRGFIMLREDGGNRLVPKIVRKRDPREDRTKITVSKTIVDRMLRENVAIISSDATRDERFDSSESVEEHEIRSAMCVPLKSRQRTLGLIYVDSRSAAGAFSQEDLMLLTAIANQAAVAIENAKLHEEIRQENLNLRRALGRKHSIVGRSEKMRELNRLIRQVTSVDTTILLRGESGTGKEVVARAIHFQGPRKAKPFHCVNCAALPESLLESELFGHEKGAFTGATERKTGRFELASGGTLFLDEVGEVSPRIQVKLLRVLQEQEFERVGGTKTIRVDVRIIASTNRDLEEAIRQAEFREDLYYRLRVIEVCAPPLRERKGDIRLLTEYFLEMFAEETGKKTPAVSPEAMRSLEAYPWPGNVRELKNAMERAVVLGVGDQLLPRHLPPELKKGRVLPPDTPPEELTLASAESRHIQEVLDFTNWNKSRTASLLGISRPRLDRKIAQYSLGE